MSRNSCGSREEHRRDASVNNITIAPNPNGLDFFNGPIFSYTFAGSEPDGIYLVLVRFTDADTGEVVAEVGQTFSR